MPVFTVIDHTELTGSANYWEETSIPSSYDHLLLKVSGRTDTSGYHQYMQLQFGDGSLDTGSNYSGMEMSYSGAQASNRISNQAYIPYIYQSAASQPTGVFGVNEVWILNYANTTGQKQVLTQSAVSGTSTTSGQFITGISGGLWRSTAAIDTLRLTAWSDNFVEYSTFTLYGVTGA